MSDSPELETFNELNLNAIKNTKLFQKFMQNKSGLMANNSSAALKQMDVKKQQTIKQSQGYEGKWNGNKKVQENARKMVVTIKKEANNTSVNKVHEYKSIQIEENEKQVDDQIYSQRQLQARLQYKATQQQATNENSQWQSLVEPYSQNYEPVEQKYYNQKNINSRGRMDRLEQQTSAVEQDLNEINRHSVANPSKRKRNFNPQVVSWNKQQQSVDIAPGNVQNRQTNSEVSVGNNRCNNRNKSNSSSYILGGQRINNQRENNLNYNNTFQKQEQEYNNSYHQKQQKKVEKYVQGQILPVGFNNNNKNSQVQSYSLQGIIAEKPSQQAYCLPVFQRQQPSVSYSEGQYRQKYESMTKKYEDLRQDLKAQSMSRKKQSSEWQQQIQLLKEKLFGVQSREDSLVIENQRLREKWEGENLSKTKTQEENKELGFRIKELEDQLAMREAAARQRADETSYWKAQVDAIKQELNAVRLGLEKRNDEYSLLYGDYQILKKERDNKDYLLDELRRSIAALVEENSAAKDQIFKLVTKLYQMEQQHQILKNDLKRQQLDASQIHNFMKDLQQQTAHSSTNTNRQRIQTSNVDRPQQNLYEAHIAIEKNFSIHNRHNQSFSMNQEQGNRASLTQQERPVIEKATRRRGEFARERGQLTRNDKVQTDERPLPVKQNNANISQDRPFRTNQTTNRPVVQSSGGNKMARIQQICGQLQKIKDMKAMNGAIRRKKIDLERELQELESQ